MAYYLFVNQNWNFFPLDFNFFFDSMRHKIIVIEGKIIQRREMTSGVFPFYYLKEETLYGVKVNGETIYLVEEQLKNTK